MLLNCTGNELVELSSTSPEIGTVKEEVNANDVEGGNLKISFNSKIHDGCFKSH